MSLPLKITFVIPQAIDIAWNIERSSLWWVESTFEDIKNDIWPDSIVINPHHEFAAQSLFMKKYLDNTQKMLQYLKALSINSPCLSQVSIQSPYYLESVVRIPYIYEWHYFKSSMLNFKSDVSVNYFNFRTNKDNNCSFLNTKARNLHILIESTRQQCEKIFINNGCSSI